MTWDIVSESKDAGVEHSSSARLIVDHTGGVQSHSFGGAIDIHCGQWKRMSSYGYVKPFGRLVRNAREILVNKGVSIIPLVLGSDLKQGTI